MIAVMNRIPVAPNCREAFEERFHSRADLIAHVPGFIRNEILRPLKGDYYVVKSYWHSVEDFERWTDGESLRQGHLLPC